MTGMVMCSPTGVAGVTIGRGKGRLQQRMTASYAGVQHADRWRISTWSSCPSQQFLHPLALFLGRHVDEDGGSLFCPTRLREVIEDVNGRRQLNRSRAYERHDPI